MEAKDLISIYDNKWKQIYYLNELDVRSLVLVVTALTGAVVSMKGSPPFPVLLEAGVAGLATIVCSGAIYSTIHNRISMEHALTAIDFIEAKLNGESSGLFRFAGNYQAPATMPTFVRRIALSVRGPVLVFFAESRQDQQNVRCRIP
jgi:hypothetical protein